MTKPNPFCWLFFPISLIFLALVGCPNSSPVITQEEYQQKLDDFNKQKENVGVKQLKLDNTETTDEDLKALCRENPNLVELTLGGTKVRGLDLSILSLKKLRKIRLSNTELSPGAIRLLSRMESLEDIDLSQTAIKDFGPLGSLPKLKRLNLYSTKVSGSDLDALKEFQSTETLVWFNIDKCPLTDAAIAKLAPLKNLEWLHLGRTELTDAGLEELAKLKTLKEVSVTNTKVTKAGIEKLRAALPDCKINENVDAQGDQNAVPVGR